MTEGVAAFTVEVRAAVEAAYTRLTWDDIVAVMSAHPRIGARAQGASAAEQSGVTDDLRPALAAANQAYEQRFGHIFLTCANGRGGADILAELRSRLENDDDTERAVVTGELLKIALLRSERLLA